MGEPGYYAGRGAASRFEIFLGLTRRFTGMSVVGLELTGLLAWTLGAFLLLRTLDRFGSDHRSQALLWIATIVPSGLIWTCSLMREPYEFAVVTASVYVACTLLDRAVRERDRQIAMVASAAVLGIGGLIHTAFTLAALSLIAGFELLVVLSKLKERRLLRGLFIIAAVLGCVVALNLAGSGLQLEDERGLRSGYSGAASYRTDLIEAGPLTLTVDTVIGYVLYVLAPLPWQVRKVIDLLALAETGLRVLLMTAGMAWGVWARSGRTRELSLAALGIAVVVQFGFSIGTLNWGTSLRHHYVSVPGLLVASALAADPLIQWATALATKVTTAWHGQMQPSTGEPVR